MTPAPSTPADTLRGIVLMTAAMLIVPLMDIVAKYLSAVLPPLEIAFGRFAFQGAFAVLTAAIGPGFAALRTRRWRANLLRGVLLAGATFAFFTAVKVMPVADAIAIFFVEPMILTGLSAVFLRETVGFRRWIAIAVGLAGALLIIRPGFAEFGPVAVLPLVTAFLFALYLLITRHLSGEDSMLSIQFTTALGGAAVLGAALLVVGATGATAEPLVLPGVPELGLLAVIGAISFFAHGLIVRAFALAPASVLAPFNYLEIVSATLFGFLVFGDFPDLPTWGGIALIVGSGLYIAHRERVRATVVAAGTADRTGAVE
ncbi:DMT family transporter [Polymorphum gilvum]|uniref:Putative transporter, permease protein n=1 Tax=Polymorphum gilvum (strain LMG 25793 / CGMCC 1.9160 / SL003B-26A1) TaxID=991905 RepID=F2J030_POLGS|nr:DMT family transporter [Polymorphum gilvum]ADZ71865.1 Putative transporter, permease protein [Polymorphum gilvum SL003B-26A1]